MIGGTWRTRWQPLRIDLSGETVLALDQTLELYRARGVAASSVVTDAGLLCLLLAFIAAPAVGLFFFIGFPGSEIAGAAAALLIGAMVFYLARSSIALGIAIRFDVLLFCFVLAVALCLLGGEGRFFYANDDWLIRDAVINDLVSQHWPFVYRLGEQSFAMRAPLAMYMLPTAVGKIYGIYAAHLALLAQNAVLFTLIFYFIVPRGRKFSQAALVVFIFVIFSGLDIVPTLGRYLVTGHSGSDHIERWAGLFQYSSHITQLFWVPHHAFAGWAVACLYLLWRRGCLRVGAVVCATLYLAYWSPFAVMGATPFLLYAIVTDWRGGKVSRTDVAAVALAAGPAALLWFYLIQGGGAVVHRFMFGEPNFWSIYFDFIYIEFIPYAAVVAALRPALIRDAGFWIAVISLLLIPFYKIGESNDFAMRASIPALALLAATFAVVLTEDIAVGNRPVWTHLATIILIVGSITGAMEIRRAVVRSLSPISACNFVQAWDQSPFNWIPMTSYLVNVDAMPGWMRPQAPADVAPAAPARCFAQ